MAKRIENNKINPGKFFKKHYGTMITWLIGIAVFLLLIIWLMGYFTHERVQVEQWVAMNEKEAGGFVAIKDRTTLPGTDQVRHVVTEYAEKRAAEEAKARERWLAAQKKRVAKAKAERLRKEAWDGNVKQAWANTKRTWKGSGWNGSPLTKGRGTITGPSGKETYYNLDMSVCVRVMRRMGYSEEKYPYEVRSDGVKTLGGYVMVAANLKIRPRGSFIMTSCGPGIVVDTGGFAQRNPTQLDLAVTW